MNRGPPALRAPAQPGLTSLASLPEGAERHVGHPYAWRRQRQDRAHLGEVIRYAQEVVVERIGQRAAEHEDVRQALTAPPVVVERGEPSDLLAQMVHHLANGRVGIEAPRVSAVKA